MYIQQRKPSCFPWPTWTATAVLALAFNVSVRAQAVPGVLMHPQTPGQTAIQPGPNASQQSPTTIAAPPLTVADKFNYRVVQTFGLRGFLGAAVSAGIATAYDTPEEWGQDAPGYFQRYGTSFATNVSRQVMAFGVEAALHEDPRYFPLSAGYGFKARTLNAAKQTFWARTDDGRSTFAYGKVSSALGASFVPNAWLPASDNSVGDAFSRFGLTLAADAGYNFLQEFIPFTRPRSLRHRH